MDKKVMAIKQPAEVSLHGDNEMESMGDSHFLNLYFETRRRKTHILLALVLTLFSAIVVAIMTGSYTIPPLTALKSLVAGFSSEADIVIWNIRLPRITAAVVSGCGLAVAGTAIQSLLRNPLASPFTLGISHGAAFGAAFAVVVLGAGVPYSGALKTSASPLVNITGMTTVAASAFAGSMVTVSLVLLMGRIRHLSAQSIILAGIAISSLFLSATILIQYLSSDVELASVVFWSFGDVARSNWTEIAVITLITLITTLFFWRIRWDLNALNAGDEAALSLGVRAGRIRVLGMIAAGLVVAVITAFNGIIAFLGLLAPHIGRRLTGDDNRLLIPFSCIIGSLLLLIADTVGRMIIGSGTMPVGVVTSFMGAPLFLYLLIREPVI